MTFFTPNQWAIVGLVLILGWILGLASRSGSGKWKRAYHQERNARRDYEKQHQARIAAANQRIAELEPYAPPISSGTASTIGAAARGNRDDLTIITGINHDLEQRLNDAGAHSYNDIARLKPVDEAALEGRLGLEPGRIEQQRWREQAELLAKGKIDEHRVAFG